MSDQLSINGLMTATSEGPSSKIGIRNQEEKVQNIFSYSYSGYNQ